jgi:hypothetical protein
VVISPQHGGGEGQLAINHGQPARGVGQPAVFADGTPPPPVTFVAASKSFCRSVDAINAHDMTLVGDASFKGRVFLVTAVVHRALKGSMVGERMNKSFGREVREELS